MKVKPTKQKICDHFTFCVHIFMQTKWLIKLKDLVQSSKSCFLISRVDLLHKEIENWCGRLGALNWRFLFLFQWWQIFWGSNETIRCQHFAILTWINWNTPEAKLKFMGLLRKLMNYASANDSPYLQNHIFDSHSWIFGRGFFHLIHMHLASCLCILSVSAMLCSICKSKVMDDGTTYTN